MIVRILGEGQYEVPDTELTRLNALDARLQPAVDTGDPAAFTAALDDLLAAVRDLGAAVPDQMLTPSELVLPAPDASLGEVAALLGDDGLIPG
jgi:hypothetical protein